MAPVPLKRQAIDRLVVVRTRHEGPQVRHEYKAMKNIKVEVSKDKKTLVLTVDLTQRHGLSGSKKTVTIASTEGNQKVGEGDIAFGLSVYTKDGLEKALKAAEAAGE